MPTVWENSYVDRLETLSSRKDRVHEVAEDVRRAIEAIRPLPDAAKILAAIATDVMTGVHMRNNRADVNDACDALQKALASLEAIGPGLDG